MKTKNILLGIASFLVAIGGAINALSAISPDYIHVQYAGDTFFTCTICDTCIGGPIMCRAVVPVEPIPGGPITPTLVNVYDLKLNPTTCVVLLTHNSSILSCPKPRRIVAVKQ